MLELYFNVIANFIIFSIVPLMILFGKKLILKPIFEVEKIDPIVIKHITRIDVLLNKNKSNTKTSDTLAEKNGLLSLQDPKETGGELSKSDEEGKLSKDN